MLADFEELLKRTMGLDPISIGSSAIARAVQQRITACGVKSAENYLERVRTSADELQELIEAVIVPETWFFRDREAFAALARMAGADWPRANPEGKLRILSLPCSTGEEPYSAAMALLDAGFPAERFTIDAIDISTRALAFARRAIFGKNSFRGDDLEFRARHFTPVGAAWQLSESVRKQVDFRAGNLLDFFLQSGAGSYDVIFCRNLLIYFDRVTQDRAMANLGRLLAPQGWLFVGPSETGPWSSQAFVSAKVPLAFAFRPATAAPPPVVRATESRAPRRVPPPRAVTPAREMPFSSVTKRASTVATESGTKKKADLEHAMRLADQGRLVEAAKECDAHLHAHGPSAKAFYVMGLVRDASGNHADAAEFYRKALYLDPRHHEALVHLAFLLDAQGDKAGAKLMNDRARRLAPKVAK
jgi:chemotaxis protein methyltransferase WspC